MVIFYSYVGLPEGMPTRWKATSQGSSSACALPGEGPCPYVFWTPTTWRLSMILGLHCDRETNLLAVRGFSGPHHWCRLGRHRKARDLYIFFGRWAARRAGPAARGKRDATLEQEGRQGPRKIRPAELLSWFVNPINNGYILETWDS